MDAPSLDFEYADSDLYFSELSELYSYSEVPEFQNTIELFHVTLESVFGAGVGDWRKIDTGQRKDFIMVMLDRFEVRTLLFHLITVYVEIFARQKFHPSPVTFVLQKH